VIAYRDHPPQDVSYITRQLPFTSDISKVKEFLKGLYASGGGDGPEAVTAAMKEALDLDWRENASKITLLIADAPPHGEFWSPFFLFLLRLNDRTRALFRAERAGLCACTLVHTLTLDD
jgi:hypothetical protein